MTPCEKEHQLLAVCDTWKEDSPLETVLVLFEVKFSSVHKWYVYAELQFSPITYTEGIEKQINIDHNSSSRKSKSNRILIRVSGLGGDYSGKSQR
jgi:hypothetical protein